MMRRLVLLALALAIPVASGATVLLPIEFREMVARSSTIVHGRVVDVRCGWIAGRRSIETLVTIETDEFLKGQARDRVVFRVPGGQVGRYRTIFVGAPEFRVGDEVVVFLRANGSAIPYVVGLSQGALRVSSDPQTGRRVVAPSFVMGRPFPLETLRDAVRQAVEAR